ncbi:MAG: DUF465 domain-containing protein [Sulfurimicrobium sp.]|jgi:hypothetical protein|nr:DUF465 domain-containing protein [Sulfurimicrobium sp.]MDP1703549.1 DUF465 domain-containing protein [Sulfurimicrobium sp.]MDP2197791.1 DUF465 domain-containing protein [Sulfurimicrobium sp.]MDP2962427.1 DUF465 domain-containing protein [Sulfurimicrobium sp.]MDP3688407.1 DUF465 domain-containing protein [Sulfurimicrobium sp.]
MLERHELAKEFPEFKDKIDTLRNGNKHFSQMFEEYHQIDTEILHIEQAVEPASDVRAEELKKRRHVLKDALYQMLQH